jgi:hypothetical protein
MPGPRKKPTVLEELHGRPGHRKRNPLEPKLGGDLLTPPGWLSKAQREEWRSLGLAELPRCLAMKARRNHVGREIRAVDRASWSRSARRAPSSNTRSFQSSTAKR